MADAGFHPQQDTRLLTAAEVAERLRIPRSTVYRLARSQIIPYLKVGRRTLFDPSALQAWVNAHTITPRQ